MRSDDPPIERLGPGVVRITAENPGPLTLTGTNSWVVGVDAVAVIDPGPPLSRHLEAIDRAVAGRPVVAVCLTHAHADHSGSAELAVSRWAGLHASAETLRRLGLPGTPLAEGDVLPVDGTLELRVLETPGHAADHLAFLTEPGRDLLTGDLVLGRGSSVVAHPDGSVGACLSSLARLASLRPARLLPGHGPAVVAAVEKLAEYRRHRRRRSDQVARALARGARTLDELRLEVYGALEPAYHEWAERSLLAHVAHLEATGHAVPVLASPVADSGPGAVSGESPESNDRR